MSSLGRTGHGSSTVDSGIDSGIGNGISTPIRTPSRSTPTTTDMSSTDKMVIKDSLQLAIHTMQTNAANGSNGGGQGQGHSGFTSPIMTGRISNRSTGNSNRSGYATGRSMPSARSTHSGPATGRGMGSSGGGGGFLSPTASDRKAYKALVDDIASVRGLQ